LLLKQLKRGRARKWAVQLPLKQLQSRLDGLACWEPDVVAAKAIKTGTSAEMGYVVAVKATAVPIGRSGA